jgi:anti-anti-sigma factor
MPTDAHERDRGDSLFQIQEMSRFGWARLAVTGELDVSTALTFRRRLRGLKASNTPVYLDLSQVEFIDGAGAHAVLDAIAASQHDMWRIEVEPNMSDQARRYFDLLKSAGVPVDF